MAYWGLRILFALLHAGLLASMRPEVETTGQVVTRFLESGARNDPGAAVALMASQTLDVEATRKQIALLFADKPQFFRGRVSTRFLSYDVRLTGDGPVLTLVGKISYRDQSSRDFVAALAKVGDSWKLLGIQFSTGVVSLLASSE